MGQEEVPVRSKRAVLDTKHGNIRAPLQGSNLIQEELLPFIEPVIVAGKPSGLCANPDDDKFLAYAIVTVKVGLKPT